MRWLTVTPAPRSATLARAEVRQRARDRHVARGAGGDDRRRDREDRGRVRRARPPAARRSRARSRRPSVTVTSRKPSAAPGATVNRTLMRVGDSTCVAPTVTPRAADRDARCPLPKLVPEPSSSTSSAVPRGSAGGRWPPRPSGRPRRSRGWRARSSSGSRASAVPVFTSGRKLEHAAGEQGLLGERAQCVLGTQQVQRLVLDPGSRRAATAGGASGRGRRGGCRAAGSAPGGQLPDRIVFSRAPLERYRLRDRRRREGPVGAGLSASVARTPRRPRPEARGGDQRRVRGLGTVGRHLRRQPATTALSFSGSRADRADRRRCP